MSTSMPLERNPCPGWDTLVDLKLGQLTEAEREELQNHLSNCPRCGEAFREINSAVPHDLDKLKRFFHFLDSPAVPGASYIAVQGKPGADAPSDPMLTSPYAKDPPQTDRWLGRTIGHYVVLGKIGQGGMGVVYRAEQVPLGRIVALKMILGGVHAGEQHLARFETESKAVARLQHPNVVQIHDFAEQDGVPYYTMELVEGGSLANRLRHQPLSPRESAELLLTVARAVEAAHQKQILHRDLKPANILLTQDGTPKIADFGLAKLLDAEAQTRASAVLGTPTYMAPEQADGRVADIDRRTDVYALGAILYECLTGEPPLRGRTTFETLELVRGTEPIPPSRRRPGLAIGLDHICLKCLEKVPSRRYPSAQALADDLGRWLRDERLVGTPTWRRRLVKRVRTNAALAWLGLATLALIGVSLATPMPPLEKVQRELAQGRAVTLIAATGKPAWFRWRMGESSSQASVGGDETFTIHSSMLALVELVPDPRQERYCFAARVRHFKGDPRGEIGVYFGRQSHPGSHADIHALTRVTFNDVFRQAVVPPNLPKGAKLKPRDNSVQMTVHLVSEFDRPEYISSRRDVANGPGFQVAGESRGLWHPIKIVVTPEKISASWDGQTFTATPKRIQEQVTSCVEALRPRLPLDQFVQRLQPTFQARGGLGLYVLNGSASFQDVTVTPLSEHP